MVMDDKLNHVFFNGSKLAAYTSVLVFIRANTTQVFKLLFTSTNYRILQDVGF